jgi:beta-phosphoglucomutase-like phosphatase (HAD superfamily)
MVVSAKCKRVARVIFDCDGVLVDSELITSRVFAARTAYSIA